jgi:hypothetical protein
LSGGNVIFKLEKASESEKSILNKENIHKKGRDFFLEELKDNLKHQELNLARIYL